MAQPALPTCGGRVDALPGRAGPLSMTGQLPARVSGTGDGMFTGNVTVTNNGPPISGVTSPQADVFVARAGEVVSTPLPKDLIGLLVRLESGASQAFTATGTVRQCTASGSGAAGGSGAGAVLARGRYDVFAVVVVNRDGGSPVVVTGGPWPIEVT
jgi:hypothetical protein